MGFKELEIHRSYISKGDENITKAFLVPALKYAKNYKRSVGFFSSSVISLILDGIVSFVRNEGHIQLIASPKLSEEDVQAITAGYSHREKLVEEFFTKSFLEELDFLEDEKLQILYELIVRGVMDIKIAVTDDVGMYHDKLGILEDLNGDKIVFYGSSNSSYGGYRSNYEKIRVAKSWEPSGIDIVIDEENEFDTLWSGTNDFVKVYNYTESAKKNIIEVIKNKSNSKKKNDTGIRLRDYQEEAISAWVKNGYKGFYVMATGTGKTWTAIYSAIELFKTNPAMLVVCAPYKHLVKQWAEDIVKAFPKAKIIMVSSENANWENQLNQEIIRQNYDREIQLIVISTIASFKMNRFMSALQKSKEYKMLIVDEAHRFKECNDKVNQMFKYMLGLSATPFSGTSAERGNDLMRFFGGQVFALTIEEALKRKFLVSYYYHPIFVCATNEEEGKFNYHSQKILSCFKNNICINPDLLVKSLRNRLRVISMAEEKQTQIYNILSQVKEKDHFVVYCGDGKLFDNGSGEEIRHIQSIKRVLSELGYKSSQFTASESMTDRMELVDAFNKGEISSLVAIRCLDEGINIPSIKSALILSSNDDYREFVQRRGRILRTYDGKNTATIYDVLVLPSDEMGAWAKIELRRYLEYARLALNWSELESELYELLERYNLQFEDIDVYDYEEMENFEDE